MRVHAVIIACAMFFASSIASATAVVTLLGTTGGNPDALGMGETITLQVTLTNPELDGINGLGLSIHGYNEAVVDFTSGEAVDSYLNAICVAPGTCFGGLANIAAGPLAESAIGANGNRVQIALSAGLDTVTGLSPSIDQGLDEVTGSSQFDIVFTGVAPGTTTLIIGTGYQGDGIILAGGANVPATSPTLTITVPEPGAVAASAAALGSVLALAGIRRRI